MFAFHWEITILIPEARVNQEVATMSKILKRCISRYSLWIPIVLIYLIPLVVVRGAFDAYLKIEGIPGESADSKH